MRLKINRINSAMSSVGLHRSYGCTNSAHFGANRHLDASCSA